MPKSTPRTRVSAASLLLMVCTLGVVSGCAASSQPLEAGWKLVGAQRFSTPAGSRALPDSVLAPAAGQAWLTAGVIVTPEPATREGLVITNEKRQVATWEAATPDGPWTLDSMNAVAGRDGPFETILYLARRGSTTVAFGSRASPTEGYPRPSTWTRDSTGWTEALQPRELFGGPDVVGYGGISAGPHGLFIAGTWSDTHGHAAASVWDSTDGTSWTREADPTFGGVAGETLFGEGVADNGHGIILIATAEAPTAQDPLAEHGVAWYSGNGSSWSRLGSSTSAQSEFGAVFAGPDYWVIAGTTGPPGKKRAAVWTVGQDRAISVARQLPGPPANDLKITATWSSPSLLFVGGVADGRPVLWSSPLRAHAAPSRWNRVQSPPAVIPDLQEVTGSSSSGSTVLVLTAKTSSEVWRS